MPTQIRSHWYHLNEGLVGVSPLEFYTLVEESVERRGLPDTTRSRVDWYEAGPFSAKREYLRIERKGLAFDICAAPFGNGFFVSWWLAEFRRGPLTLLAIFAGLVLLLFLLGSVFGFLWGFLLWMLTVPTIFIYLARHAPEQLRGWDDPIRAFPVIGPYYEVVFRPLTYYQNDTLLMFQDAVHAAVRETIALVTERQGVPLHPHPDDRPVMRGFLGQ